MATVDSSVTDMDHVDVALTEDSVATSAHGEGENSAGGGETVKDDVDCMDSANITESSKDEDITSGVVTGVFTHSVGLTIADCVDDVRDENADATCTEGSMDSADLTDSRSIEINDIMDSVDQSESDCDSACEGSCLEAMTSDGQEYYLRLGGTPRRRSALRLSRIIARQQLLRRLVQGRYSEKNYILKCDCL